MYYCCGQCTTLQCTKEIDAEMLQKQMVHGSRKSPVNKKHESKISIT